jgi:hypothetical protein
LDIQPAVNFLIGSILFSIGIIVVSMMIVVVNNLFSKYWKPIKWQVFQEKEFTFVEPEYIDELKRNLAKQSTEKKYSSKQS